MSRLSPSFPCICGQQDWSYDENQVRWICNACVRAGRPIPPRPDYDKVFDFDAWYRSVMDDWDTALKMLSELPGEPEDMRGKLIHRARVKKISDELKRASNLAGLATLINETRNDNSTGDIYVNVPDVELRVRW